MKNLFIALLLFMFSFGANAQRHEHISLIKLFSNAEKYEGKPVSVAGVLGRGRGDDNYVLYFDLGSQENAVRINSLIIVSDEETRKGLSEMCGKYVLVFGNFNGDAPRGLESGMLVDVKRIGLY